MTLEQPVKLPNLEHAVVSEEKITDYLLSRTHRDGRHKAAFFESFGFSTEDWQSLQRVLLQHAADHEVTKMERSPFGVRYVIEGIITAQDGRTPMIRSVWFVENGEDAPRFVTAYPLRREQDD
jgi:hypothetical protein